MNGETDARLRVKLEEGAQNDLQEIQKTNKKAHATILKILTKRLPIDPYPDPSSGWGDSEIYDRLKNELGIEDVLRLRFRWREAEGYRAFYFVNEKRGDIVVCAVVPRDKDTYKKGEHYARIREAYLRYYSHRD